MTRRRLKESEISKVLEEMLCEDFPSDLNSPGVNSSYEDDFETQIIAQQPALSGPSGVNDNTSSNSDSEVSVVDNQYNLSQTLRSHF